MRLHLLYSAAILSQQCLSEVRESTGKAVAEMAFAMGAVEWLERLCMGTVAVAAGNAPPRAIGAAGAGSTFVFLVTGRRGLCPLCVLGRWPWSCPLRPLLLFALGFAVAFFVNGLLLCFCSCFVGGCVAWLLGWAKNDTMALDETHNGNKQ